MMFSLLSDTANPPWNFGVFGIGAIVFVILSTWLFLELRDHKTDNRTWFTLVAEKDKQISDLQLGRLQDAFKAAEAQRLMAERTLPLLTDTAKVLDASLVQARAGTGRGEADLTVDLVSAIRDLHDFVEETRRQRDNRK